MSMRPTGSLAWSTSRGTGWGDTRRRGSASAGRRALRAGRPGGARASGGPGSLGVGQGAGRVVAQGVDGVLALEPSPEAEAGREEGAGHLVDQLLVDARLEAGPLLADDAGG